MTRICRTLVEAGTLAGLLLCAGTIASAQYGQGTQSQPPPPPPAQPGDKSKPPSAAPLTLDTPAPPPVNPEEEAAYKAYQDETLGNFARRIELGEAFVQKYPQSRYLPPIYSGLTIAYMQTNQVQKMLDIGEKAVTLTPTDVTTLAILAQTISRVTNSTTPNAV